MRTQSPFRVALVSCALLVASLASAENPQKHQDLDSLLSSAKIANLRAPDALPFHLHLQVHAERITAKPVDGEYDEVWNAPDQWRRQIDFPQFREIETGDKDGRWMSRNVDFQPQASYLMGELLDALFSPLHSPDAKLKKMHKAKKDGVQLQCADLEGNHLEYTLCFDENGFLSSSGYRNLQFEYRDYQKLGARSFPRELTVEQDHKQVLQVRLAELTDMSTAEKVEFPHPASSMRLSRCERWVPGIPVKKVPPHYPESARTAHQQGTVVLYALLLMDGSVRDVKVLQSAGVALDQAAVEAVTQWVYSPMDCGGSPYPTEIEVTVHFELQ